MGNESDIMGVGVNGMNGGSLPMFGISPDGTVPDAASNMTDEQSAELRGRGVGLGGGREGNRMPGPSPGGSNRASFDQQSYAGQAASMPSGMNPSLAFNVRQGQNGHSYSQGYDYASHGNSNTMQPQPPAGQEWSQMFQPNQPGFQGQYNPALANSQIPIKTEYKQEIKAEPSLNMSHNGVFSGIYPNMATGQSNPPSYPSWANLQNDPLDEISNRLIYICFPNNQIIGRANEVRKHLSGPNIKHFLEQFTSFQGHFPIIHMPSFRIADAFDGLLLAMICIGAVYSNRMAPSQVREMMELAKHTIERNSQVYSVISREQTGDSGFGGEPIGSSKSELEQITAIFMMQILFTWHGTPVQREKARREFPTIAELARRAGLTKPMVMSPFSVLHQPNVTVENFSAASFDWNAWVEQEKRSRLMFMIFLLDAAMVMYFNTAPRFEKDEIRLPLPADDAAWDATTSNECADALGLNGPAAQSKNPEGSRRPKQPELPVVMKNLINGDWLQPGTTNLYSKFILVHALHAQLWTAQRQFALQSSGQLNPHSMSFPSSGTTTPIHHDSNRGIDPTGSGPHSTNTSGRGTPVDNGISASQKIKAISNAFEKWKKAWDDDMAIQYPPSTSNYRRFGFCRDAVHFYWLAKYLLQNPRGFDWQMAPDQRCSQVFTLLKAVKNWVQTDSAKRGEELGSVNDIDKDYGLTDLTLDMAQLFKPINQQIDSPVPGVQTNMG